MSNTKTVMSQAANTQGIPLDITDVFSTYVYKGTGSAQTITNGIDLDGEGGLVWLKARNNTQSNWLYDSERSSFAAGLRSDTVANEYNPGTSVTSVSSSGFTLGTYGEINQSNIDYASWTFRKAPKFFDVVTYTGNGPSNTQNISHNLGSTPGMLVVKATSTTDNWHTWHRGFGDNGYIMLNSTNAKSTYADLWDDTAPTDTHFTVSDSCNTNNVTYVAYVFAHNDGDGEFGPSGDQDIIKCGSFTFPSSGDVEIDLGFEPQWVITKRVDGSSPWWIADNMRGWASQKTGGTFSSQTGGNLQALFADTSSPEVEYDYGGLTSTGFKWASNFNAGTGNTNYIYIAIRRGSLAPPESGTEVFEVDSWSSTTEPAYTSNFPVDMALHRLNASGVNAPNVNTRMLGATKLLTSSTAAESFEGNNVFDFMDGWYNPQGYGPFSNYYSWMWKRAPGFFDVVAYTGDGTTARAIPHNLGVAPEMMIHKRRNATNDWYVPDFQNSQLLILNGNYAAFNTATLANYYGSGNGSSGGAGSLVTPDASTFTVTPNNNVNASGNTYIAYLFASLPGISKVGSYTGNGSSQTIDCGFTSGARFVLVKCTTVGYDWQVFDTERGIVAGNDSKLALNTTQAEQTNGDFIDPSSSGFAVTSSSSMNANGETFIFYAIA